MTKKKVFLFTILSQLGKPYIWAGDDPGGVDCSGLVCMGLRACGLLPNKARLAADGLMKRYISKRISKPKKGALIFYLDVHQIATHVTVCLDRQWHIGANGGGEGIDTPREAWDANAFVKIRPIMELTDNHIVCDPFVEV